MRNLKKILALVLALVMSMSLISVAGATFADDADIANKDAAEVLYTLGVVEGKGANKFDPKGLVKRGEMAKMITVISLGTVDVAAFKGTATDLTDVAGHWAEGYINYCYSQGIISGKGAGVFAPDAYVTSAEAAKMLLVAIGYNATVQGYTGVGDKWAVNVARDAQLSGFYAGLSVPSEKQLTRDEAAQMMYNALLANTIAAEPTLNITNGQVSYTYRATGAPLLKKTFGVAEYVDAIGSINYNSTNKEYRYTASVAFADQASTDTEAYFETTADYCDLLGEEVSVLVKFAKNGTYTILGMYPTGKTTVEIAAASSVTAPSTGKLKINGTTYTTEAPLDTAFTVSATDDDMVKFTDIDNNGKLDSIVTTVIEGAKVSYVSATEIIAGGTSYKFSGNKIADTLVKGDYVSIAAHIKNGSYTIEELTKISGKVEGFKTGKVLVNGNWYNFAGSEFTNTVAGKNVEFYAINNVIVAGTGKILDSTSLENVVMLLDTDTTNVINYALILKQDGKKVTVKVDEISSGALTGTALNTAGAGQLFTIAETDYGTKFTAVSGNIGDYTYATPVASDVATTGTKVETVSGKAIADDAIIFVKTNTNDGKVITGKQLKTLVIGAGDNNIVANSVDGSFSGKVGGMNRVVLAAVASGTSTFSVGNSAGNYALVVESDYKVDSNYITYKIWDGSEVLTVKEKKISALGTRTQKTLIKYSAIKDGVISDVTSAGEAKGAVLGLIGSEVSFDGVNMKKLTDKTVYMYYDSSASDAAKIGFAGGELQLATTIEGVAKQNVKYVLDSSDSSKVAFVLIDVKNELADATTYTIGLSETVTAGTTTVAFQNESGSAITITAGNASLAAGEIINVVISATADDDVEINFNPTNMKPIGGYTAGALIRVAAGETVTYSFVTTATPTNIVVADHP